MSAEIRYIGSQMSPDARLAVVLRQLQWDLDSVAYRLPRGEVTVEERQKLSEQIRELASLLAVKHVQR